MIRVSEKDILILIAYAINGDQIDYQHLETARDYLTQ